MLKGQVVTLRPVNEIDLDRLYERHTDLESRGNWFPRGVLSRPAFRRQYEETGFWGRDEGMLVMVTGEGALTGHIEFFKTVNYLDEYELSYQVYSAQHRGRGMASEAVAMLTRYLFETRPIHRIRLVIHPENTASIRLAKKCGFRHEGTARGAWYNRGRYNDVEVYSILHDEVIRDDGAAAGPAGEIGV